ncbi:MAG: glycosyltransferase family 2 protein [Prevotella sp.]|nr:glycosyltransferase family 2 protein [Prevotella sp.]MBP3842072.1 glycosyltransferase family 2 protein [Prevotella sp.]
MKLSVIIVNYNVRYYIEQCINSVERATKDIETEIFVVDNHSTDGSVPYLRRRFGKRIELIESNHNLGFARANNKAIRESTGEYVLLLNPDTFVGEDAIRQVVDFLDAHPKAGGIGVKMHNADGTLARESRRGIPTPFVSMLKMFGFSKRYYMSYLSWDEPGRIEVISGAFCMVRRKVLDEVGLLDKDFFMYGEDIDLSYRILKGGYENWFVPANILHYKGESTQKSSFRYVHVFYQAMIIFFRKHYGHLSFLFTIPIQVAIYLRAFIALIGMQNSKMWHSIGLGYDKDFATQFCFIGSGAMLNECKKLARRKALDATFCKNIEEIGACDVLVFEVDDKYNYEDVLAYAREHAGTFEIGTYSRKNHVLITPKEIIQ